MADRTSLLHDVPAPRPEPAAEQTPLAWWHLRGRRVDRRVLARVRDGLLADEDLIRQAREEAAAVVAEDPGLTGHQPLAEAIADLLGPQRAEFLDKT